MGNIKTASVVKEADGWYITLCSEVDVMPLPLTPKVVGLDVGIKSFVVTSDGQVVDNPKHLSKCQFQLEHEANFTSRNYRIPGYKGTFGIISSVPIHFVKLFAGVRILPH